MQYLEKLFGAQNREDYDSVLREILATAEKRELEQLVVSLTSKARHMEPTEERNKILRGIQSLRAALKIRFFEH